MAHYLLIESRDPFEYGDPIQFADLAVDLAGAGNQVTMFLVQNGVLATRKQAQKSHLPQLLESGVTVIADDFSLRERGIRFDECRTNIRIASIDQLVDLVVQENTKAIWH